MSKERIVFLDYDGVVNIPMWKQKNGAWHCLFNNAYDGAVNDEQAVQWISEFCQKYNFSIVVTSTWRGDTQYKDYLVKAGLRKGVEILGRTPYLKMESTRGQEIKKYLFDHPEITEFLIFDDEKRGLDDLSDHLVLCNPVVGFTMVEFTKAENLFKTFKANYRREEMPKWW